MVSSQASGLQRATASFHFRDADRLLIRSSRHGRAWTVLLAVTAIVETIAQVALPALLGGTVDALVSAERSLPWVFGCGVVVVLMVLSDALGELAAGRSAAAGTAWLRHTLVDHMLALGDHATRRFPSGDLVSRLVSNTAEAGSAAGTVVWAVASVLPTVGSVVALWVIYPWLAIAFIVGLPALIALLRTFTRDTTDLITRYQQSQGDIAAALVSALSGIRTIRAAGTADREEGRVLRGLPELSGLGHGMWRAQTKMASQGALLVPLLEVAVLAVAGFALTSGHISPGDMLAAWRYVTLGAGFGMTAIMMSRLARSRAGVRRIHQVLSEPAMQYGTSRLPTGRGHLELRNVSLRWGREEVLTGLDLDLPAGTSLAVVGRSGGGKSLLAALAGRMLDPDRGVVLLDGVPLHTLERREIRRAIGYAFERPVLIGDTLGEAIDLGRQKRSAERVKEAARAAEADTFVMRLPQGYRTRPQDASLSGGEAQRLGLARAFAHGGRVLILDDATSSLDTATEMQISSVLTGQLSDRTRLIVAHRASTAALADFVVWLDGGRIRAMGRHHDLWRDSAYRANFTPETSQPPSSQAPSIDSAGSDHRSTPDHIVAEGTT